MQHEIKLIEVFGPGCSRCQETYRVMLNVVAQAGLNCDVTKVDDFKRMAALGIMATPAIVVDGTVVLSGRVPKAEEARRLLRIG